MLNQLEPWTVVAAFILGITVSIVFAWAIIRIQFKRHLQSTEGKPFIGSPSERSITLRPAIQNDEIAGASGHISINNDTKEKSRGIRPGRQPNLIGTQGTAAGVIFNITKSPMTIGRDSGNDIVIPENTVSRRHAQLEQVDSGLICLVDKESANGVYVNGQRTQLAYLNDGDEVKIGDNYFIYSI